MNTLSTKQINNLITGNSLALEIPASSDDLRCFVVIGAYKKDQTGKSARASKFLNTEDKSNLLFWLRKYEVKKQDIERYIADSDLVNSVHIKDISSVENLEFELAKYLSDLSQLDVEWKCDNPL
ncbi:MAG TPA: hypothetical protein PK566_18620 [Pseudobacteroides sp.]|nr:hypothetical protein [Pseudobacteroides sp.]